MRRTQREQISAAVPAKRISARRAAGTFHVDFLMLGAHPFLVYLADAGASDGIGEDAKFHPLGTISRCVRCARHVDNDWTHRVPSDGNSFFPSLDSSFSLLSR
jgi:hypothetical protein